MDAPTVIPRGGIDIGQKDPLKTFNLIRAEGELEESLACFQMLAGHLRLPFRKDSIEKILRDSLRRGQSPNIQLCGQIGASLGLHVTNAKAPSRLGVRLQVPSLIVWKGTFAIAIRRILKD